MGEVSRRSFMQSMSAAMAAVVVGRLPASEARTVIDYSRFCDQDSSRGGLIQARYTLDSPWSHEGITYATDGRVIIRHAGEFTGGGDGRFPDISMLAWDATNSRGWRQFPAIQRRVAMGEPGRCPECRGVGLVDDGIAPCPKCDGLYDEYFGDDAVELPSAGYHDFDGRWVSAKCLCPDCTMGRIGGRKCGYCNGSGAARDCCERVGGLLFAGWYVDSIRDLPSPEYRAFDGSDGSGRSTPMLAFRFGAEGGCGLLMPITEDAK